MITLEKACFRVAFTLILMTASLNSVDSFMHSCSSAIFPRSLNSLLNNQFNAGGRNQVLTDIYKYNPSEQLRKSFRDNRRCLLIRASLPRDVKETLSQLRQSMQAGLSSRCSRMDIELPYAVNLGIERSKTGNSQVIAIEYNR